MHHQKDKDNVDESYELSELNVHIPDESIAHGGVKSSSIPAGCTSEENGTEVNYNR